MNVSDIPRTYRPIVHRLIVFSERNNYMTHRVFNFNAGPSPMPLSVLEEIREEFTDYKGTGMGIIEMSHRSKEFQAMLDETKDLLTELMGLTAGQKIVFIQGGGSMQFLMEACNFLHTRAAYADTGVWAHKARDAAKFYGEAYDANTAKDTNYTYIPGTYDIRPGTDYLHITANNTIYGTEYWDFPKVDVPVICDMSSDILSRPLDFNQFGMVWAGIQKNLGAAGTALAIIKPELLETARDDIPDFLKYKTFVDKDSTYNTPAVFCIYTLNKMLHWVKNMGGTGAMAVRNQKKAAYIYDIIDGSQGFYKGHAEKAYRSRMNVTFNLADADLEKDFVAKAKENGFIGVNGHRLVGGCRVSLYNAVTPEAAEAMAGFMKEYMRVNG